MNLRIFAENRPFQIGCNYWASHAGPNMWRDWKPELLEADLRLLAEHGIRLLRVFPNWRDFQPLIAVAGYQNAVISWRTETDHVEADLFDPNDSGVSETMLNRFRLFAQLAQKYHIELEVALVTGWMSGRMFVPPGLSRNNLLSDPETVHWQVRFVRHFVRALRDEPAIVAWSPGNECECLEAATPATLWQWFHTISAAIRQEDPTRPILAGCNLTPTDRTIRDIAESVDLLSAHAYSCFTPYCRVDPLNTMRNVFQGVFLTRCCADLGRTSALIEEVSSLGTTQNDETVAAAWLNNLLWNAWSHDCRALLWWCAFDQTGLDYHPYNENCLERELGLFRQDGTPKPQLEVLRKFGTFASSHALPPPHTDAVLLLSREQDRWGVGFLSFLLAKQAGFDVRVALADDPLPEAKLYLLPSITGFSVLPLRRYQELLAKVETGATLYLSANDAGIEPFAPFGISIRTISGRSNSARIINRERGWDFTLNVPHKIRLAPGEAEILARDEDGDPAFTVHRYGKGKLFFLNVPMENALAPLSGVFEPEAAPWHQLYRLVADAAGIRRLVTQANPLFTLTEHPVSDTCVLLVVVNNSPEPAETELLPVDGWSLSSGNHLKLAGNTGILLELLRRNPDSMCHPAVRAPIESASNGSLTSNNSN